MRLIRSAGFLRRIERWAERKAIEWLVFEVVVKVVMVRVSR